jgi:hydroxymethylpyrimidine pyrophosphatase-like HAD family hydrolase
VYKALITDLDGTAIAIASYGEDIDTATVAAVTAAIAAGKLIACATGREWADAEPVVRKLGLQANCIIEGGTRIVCAKNGTTIWQKAFETGGPARVLMQLHDITNQGMVMLSDDSKRYPLAELDTVPGDLRFIYLLGIPSDTAERLCDAINASPFEVAHMTPSWTGNSLLDVHVTHRAATKEHAIAIWQQIEKVSHNETIGLGDSGNDLPIFESSGLKVAVDNASLALKERADIIAPANDKQALKYVIDTYLLS